MPRPAYNPAAELQQMEFDLGSVLLGAVVMLFVAILIGMTIAAAFGPPEPEARVSQELDELAEQVSTLGQGLVTLREDVERLYQDIEQLADETEHMRTVLRRISELLERFPQFR